MKRNVGRLFTLLSASFLILGAAWAIHVYWGYARGREEYAALSEKYVRESEEDKGQNKKVRKKEEKEIQTDTPEIPSTDIIKEEGISDEAPDRKTIDFAGLNKINKDVVGWIDLSQLSISYPLLLAEDNDFYLHRDIHKQYLYAGSVFIDASCDGHFQDDNTIIYGHNMTDGSMFGRLRDLTDQDFFEKYPYFWIYTKEGDFLYEIFSVHEDHPNGISYAVRFSDNGKYFSWLEEMARQSIVQTKPGSDLYGPVVTLSTCTNNDSVRLLVQGMRVSEIRHE